MSPGRSNNTSGSGSGSGGAGGVYTVGTDEKWKPGQEMRFPAAEAKIEKNPYASDAVQAAGDTQNIVKDGLKEAEHWVENKAKDLFGGNKH
ncbi:hypothetical protein FRC14_006296 [Serendipita sp. 396]|nr:hypothetical protein FRC14_006296 [Serendipita sp. 396]